MQKNKPKKKITLENLLKNKTCNVTKNFTILIK